MKKCLSFLMLVLAFSCDEVGVQPVSSEQIFKKESGQINWKEVDSYPTFEFCDDIIDKNDAKRCFEEQIAAYIYEDFGQNEIKVTEDLNDTIFLFLKITESGAPQIDSIQIDSLLESQLPEIRQWLNNSVDSLPQIHPANKRGIPVTTVFKLPIIVTAE